MAERAELIFVSGPQQGQRAVLPGGTLLAGRSPECDVHLTEEHASRQQLRLQLTPEGWVVENLSTNRIRVNGRKYKKGRKIVLDTGDVMGVGLATQMLYVAAGDDSEQALQAWRLAHPATRVEPAPEKPQPPPPKSAPLPETAKPPPAQARKKTEEIPKALDEEQQAKKRQARTRKYCILFGVYAAIMIVVFVVIYKARQRDDVFVSDRPQRLQKADIEEAIKARFERTSSPPKAEEARLKAMALYRARKDELGNLYKSVKYFKLYLAYTHTHVPGNPKVAATFEDATKELVNLVDREYSDAWIYEQDKNWSRAEQRFNRLLRIVPAKSEPEPEPRGENVIFENVIEHLKYIGAHIGRKT